MAKDDKMLLVALLLVRCVCTSEAVWALRSSTQSCAEQGLNCTVTTSNCMDKDWLVAQSYTPSEPDSLEVTVGTREDDAGHLQPVLLASWTLRDEGSICYLKATELHVLVTSTNQNLCVRYSLSEKLEMRNPFWEKWRFSSDAVVVEPGEMYKVSVFNIPKPELGHTSYDITREVGVPDCQDPRIRESYPCIQTGSFWLPDISLAHTRALLTVNFNTHPLSDKYVLMLSCGFESHTQLLHKGNHTVLNATFDVGKWPRSCCQFDVEIKPLFPQCGEDCTRRKKTVNICPAELPEMETTVPAVTFVAIGVAVLCAALTVILCLFCRRTPVRSGDTLLPGHRETQKPPPPERPPKLLIIYSQDHRLYRDIVLKFCAFLRAKCGIDVLLDLLDSSGVSSMGGPRWLEKQRQQLNQPCDKILLLCSRGVQAKWGAMIGHGQVTLREDALSPTDDLLIPFLNLFLPDMQQAGMQGKYMVAYFDDVSNQQDVPSAFNIAVKYKLMKHFEELYFRLLDIEKYQPGQINHIEGIGCNEYFNCPSGKVLMNAIETFKVHQLENPDWFERECLDSGEKVVPEGTSPVDQPLLPPVYECVPQIVEERPPVHSLNVEINSSNDSVRVLTAELNPQSDLTSVSEIAPMVNPPRHLYQTHLHPNMGTQSAEHLNPHRCGTTSMQHSPNHLICEEVVIDPAPSLPPSCPTDRPSSMPQKYPDAIVSEEEVSPWSQPVEMEEGEVLGPAGKGHCSGSDQGYVSQMSSQPYFSPEEDPNEALEELFLKTYMHTDMYLEGN